MRIMDLDFRTAVKYAYLGDAIYRLESGRRAALCITSAIPGVLTHANDPYHLSPANISGFDLAADDWVAETTDRSV